MDVLDSCGHIGVVAEERVPEPTLEEMPDPVMSTIEALRMYTLDVSKRLTEVAFVVLDHEVNVVCHQAVGMEVATKALSGFSKKPQKRPAVFVVEKDRKPVVASCGDVVIAAGWVDSQWSRHSTTVRKACDI